MVDLWDAIMIDMMEYDGYIYIFIYIYGFMVGWSMQHGFRWDIMMLGPE